MNSMMHTDIETIQLPATLKQQEQPTQKTPPPPTPASPSQMMLGLQGQGVLGHTSGSVPTSASPLQRDDVTLRCCLFEGTERFGVGNGMGLFFLEGGSAPLI